MARYEIPTSSSLRKKEEDKRKAESEKELRFNNAATKIMPDWKSEG